MVYGGGAGLVSREAMCGKWGHGKKAEQLNFYQQKLVSNELPAEVWCRQCLSEL